MAELPLRRDLEECTMGSRRPPPNDAEGSPRGRRIGMRARAACERPAPSESSAQHGQSSGGLFETFDLDPGKIEAGADARSVVVSEIPARTVFAGRNVSVR